MMMKTKTTTSRRYQPPAPAAGDDFMQRVYDRLERIGEKLESSDARDIICDFDVMRRIAREEYATLNIAAAEAHQQIMRNVIGVLIKQANRQAARDVTMDAYQESLDATEDIALRAGYFVGIAQGLLFSMRTEQIRKVSKARKIRLR